MSISSVSNSNYIAPSTVIQGANGTAVTGTKDTDGDGDGGGSSHKVRSGHKGGGIGQALMQALQSMGLNPSPTTSTSATQSASSSSTGTDSDSDKDGSGSGSTGSVKNDMRNLMHTLFQAIKGESTSTSSTSASSDPKSNFASGLSALISQVSNGSAPPALQVAFDKLAGDMQQSAASTASATASASASNSSTSSQISLQKMLDQLQQNLGYGASSNASAVGNLLSTTA